MIRYPKPTASDQADFLLHLYFSAGDDALDRAISGAYRDLCRTIHGIGKYPQARSKAAEVLALSVRHLADSPSILTQEDFDSWHRTTCEKLHHSYIASGYENFTVGQAQKWLNMTLKYVFVFGEGRLPGYSHIYPFCHVPIDNIILKSPDFAGVRINFEGPWSRISDYKKYLDFQKEIRAQFPESAPLAVEFWAWQKPGRDQSASSPEGGKLQTKTNRQRA